MAVAKASKFSPKLFWRLTDLGWDLGFWVKLDVNPVCIITVARRKFNGVEATWALKLKQQSTGAKLNGTKDQTCLLKKKKILQQDLPIKIETFCSVQAAASVSEKCRWEYWDEYRAQTSDQTRTLLLRSWIIHISSAYCSLCLDIFLSPAYASVQS